jgi:hypothetical protein
MNSRCASLPAKKDSNCVEFSCARVDVDPDARASWDCWRLGVDAIELNQYDIAADCTIGVHKFA